MREKLLSYGIFLISLNFKALYLLKKFPIFLSCTLDWILYRLYQWIVLISTTYIFLFQVGPPCIGFNYILPTTTAQEISFNFRAWLLVGGERSRCKKLWRKEDERRKRRSFTGPTMGSKPIWSLPGFPGLPGFPAGLGVTSVLPCYSEVLHVYAMGDVSGGKLSLK